MTKVELNSTMLALIDYDKDDRTLIVEFANGDEYKYKDVPQETFDEMRLASSSGKYFLAHIKNKFEYEKLD